MSSQQGWGLVLSLSKGGGFRLWEEPGLGVGDGIPDPHPPASWPCDLGLVTPLPLTGRQRAGQGDPTSAVPFSLESRGLGPVPFARVTFSGAWRGALGGPRGQAL